MKPVVSPFVLILFFLSLLPGRLDAQVAPLITVEPEDLTLVEGDYVYFEVTATGSEPLNYQWRKNGSSISGATDAVYLKDPAVAADSAAYTVRVFNSWGAVTSVVANLLVLIPPNITTHPLSKTVTAGSNVTFTAKASGSPPLDYQWYQDNMPVGGATSTNLTITNVQPEHAGDYIVVVSNPAGDYGAEDAVSTPATLTVIVPPTILDPPDSIVADQGDDVLFSVLAEGTDTETHPLTYQWVFKGNYLIGQTDPILELFDIYPGQEGDYRVIVANAGGSITSSNAYLTVQTPPVFILNPLSRTVYPGSNMIFTCQATGTPPIEYQWFHNGVLIEDATNTSYSVFLAGTAQRGMYSVVASNMVADTWATDAYLTVKAESVLPTVAITFPAANQRWSNSVITVRGTANDNAVVDFVEYADHFQPAGQGFQRATAGFTNLNPYVLIWTNWTATYSPNPGTNLVRAVATDDSANRSTTAELRYFYVVPSPFTLVTNGPGVASTNLGDTLEIGKQYLLTALPGPGAVFTNWTGGYTTNHPTIRFMMTSNLVLNMNFRDVQAPVVTVTNPLPAGTQAGAQAVVGGTASDNWQIATVWYRLNSNAWAVASGTTNWAASVTLVSGTNTFSVYGVDAGGNVSPTNTTGSVVTLALPQPQILSLTRSGSVIHVSFTTATGLTYHLERKDAPPNGPWITLLPSVLGTGGVASLTDTNAPPASRYYRVRGM